MILELSNVLNRKLKTTIDRLFFSICVHMLHIALTFVIAAEIQQKAKKEIQTK